MQACRVESKSGLFVESKSGQQLQRLQYGMEKKIANKRQLGARLAPELVRDTLQRFSEGLISADEAGEILELGRTRLYELRTAFLAAKGQEKVAEWCPGLSGGNHCPPWPKQVTAFLQEALAPGLGADRFTYAFAASEIMRRFKFAVDRGQVRAWAIANGMAVIAPSKRVEAHGRRWQRHRIGELFQLDATPDYFLGQGQPKLTLINMLDDCSRLQIGCKLYYNESLLSYIDFFGETLLRAGLPQQIYVDNAGFFRSTLKDALTQLGERLRLYGVSFRYATSPQSKGKVERVHQVWQSRLHSYFRLAKLDIKTPLNCLNDHVQQLVDYRNRHETHREINEIPQNAWDRALAEGRSCLRAVPHDGWWPIVWSLWRIVTVATGSRVYYDPDHYLKIRDCARGMKLCLCCHPDGTHTVIPRVPTTLRHPPEILGTTHPQIP